MTLNSKLISIFQAHCRKSSKKCSEHRPCDRCVTLCLECIDIARVTKNRKSNNNDHDCGINCGLNCNFAFEKPPTAPTKKKKSKHIVPTVKPEFNEEQGKAK